MVKSFIKSHRLIIISSLTVVIMVVMWIAQLFQPNQRNILSYSDARRGVNYCQSKNPYQTLDLFRPKHSGGRELPIVVYIHGGGWSGGTKNNDFIMNVWGPHFIKKGMAVATIGYQTKAQKLYPTENNDIACALTYLKKNASKYKIDTSQMIMFGTSAGGQLAAYAALTAPGGDLSDKYDYPSPKGVIDFYGVSNFSTIVVGSHPDYNARRYLGKDYIKKAPKVSPVNFVRSDSPPFLLAHGTRDSIVPMSQSQQLYNKLTKAGVRVTMIEVEGGAHGFRGPELTKKEYSKLKQAVDDFTKETIGG